MNKFDEMTMSDLMFMVETLKTTVDKLRTENKELKEKLAEQNTRMIAIKNIARNAI